MRYASICLLTVFFFFSFESGSAQELVCEAIAANPLTLRVEGITELTGDLLIRCVGGTPTLKGQSIPTYNITATFNTNVTSRIVSGNWSEALLLIDEPFPAQPVPVPPVIPSAPPQIACAQNGVLWVVCNDKGDGGGGYGEPSDPYNSQPNIFGGSVTQPNQITFTNVPFDPPGVHGVRWLRLTNLRVNASQLGLSATQIPTPVVMTVAFNPINGVPGIDVNNAQQTVAYVQAGIFNSVVPARLAQCNSHNSGLLGGTIPAAFDFTVQSSEGFAQTFKKRNIGLTADGASAPPTYPQNVPGWPYNTETALYIPALFTGPPDIGLADFDTRIQLTFNNVAPGTHIFVPLTAEISKGIGPNGQVNPSLPPQPLAPVPPGIPNARAQLVQADQYGNSLNQGYLPVASTATIGGSPVAEVNYLGDTGYATYAVVNSDPSSLETVLIPVAVAFSSSGQSRPALGTVTVNANLAPAGGLAATSAVADGSSRLPRFSPAADPSSAPFTAYQIAACTTLDDFGGTGLSGALLYDPLNGQEYTALSNGNGTYSYLPNLFTSAFDILRTGDFNGDGKTDLVLYNSKAALAYIGMGNGDGTFAFQSLFWSPGYNVVESGDLNGDGKADFALYNSSTGTMYTAISNGNGTFTYKYTLITSGYTFFRLADFTGDGNADMFLYNVATGQANLGVGDGTGGFTFHALSMSPGYDLADLGDLNGDGKMDVIVYNSTNGNAATGISDGAGGLTFSPLLFSPGFTSVRLANYTGGGKADITLYNKNNATAYFGTGNGAGSFTFQSLFWSQAYDVVEPQDVNGDGKVDVILYNSTTGTEYTGVSNGNGTFTYSYSLWGPGKMLAR